MKTFGLAIAAFFIIGGPAPAASVLLNNRKSAVLSPVGRVAELLNGLVKQIEKEGKAEEDLYESFVCWGKSVISQKTATNKAANIRIDELEQYISDLDAGKIELTTERVDLEKEVEGLKADLETAKNQREKEKADFQEAKEEMEMAIDALESAIKVLKEATKDSSASLLLSSAELNGGVAAVAQQSRRLQRAVDLGQKFLTKADALFLNRVLSGDVPDVDWQKLNNKATFKMSYKKRSGKIQDILARLHSTFETNLKEATAKEKEAQDTYDKLSKAKGDTLDKTQKAYSSMAVEKGAQGKSRGAAQDEVDALKEQIKNDSKFIAQTETSLDEKEKEWNARSELRSGELQALSKAISILHSDDARDLFSKSFESQGFFLQLRQSRTVSLRQSRTSSGDVSSAISVLRDAASRSGNTRMLALVELLSSGKPVPGGSQKVKFKPVVDAIVKMVKLLKEEEEADLKYKQDCEAGTSFQDRKSGAHGAIELAHKIDDLSDDIMYLEDQIQMQEGKIKNLVAQKKKTKEELDKATDIRKEENAAWKLTDKDDKDAMEIVKSATDVIKKFYSDNKLETINTALIQRAASRQKQPETVAGEAPPPPPATWETPEYGGKKHESSGMIALLEMVYEDIERDCRIANEEEDQALKEYTKFKDKSEDEMSELQDWINKWSGRKGDTMQEKAGQERNRQNMFDEWKDCMKNTDAINPGCNFFMGNYMMRLKNRQIEMDGLNKAKAILTGATFVDPHPDDDFH